MELTDYFSKSEKYAFAFSGGVDSAYLLYAAVKSGADVAAYYVKTSFQPQFELSDARELAQELGIELNILPVDILSCDEVRQNPANRCYYCKQGIFSAIIAAAKRDGCTIICDGTNASDDAGDRPGMKALREMAVSSPLRECGLTKTQIRELSREAGLFTWNKPAYACLATRIPSGTEITAELLGKTERAEGYLFSLGFRDFRVRYRNGGALLQVKAEHMAMAREKFAEISEFLSELYDTVVLDSEAR